jgi:hypothetical protein
MFEKLLTKKSQYFAPNESLGVNTYYDQVCKNYDYKKKNILSYRSLQIVGQKNYQKT